jgi:polyisoprenoid-binding protein YceI
MSRSMLGCVMGSLVGGWLVGATPALADQASDSRVASASVLHVVPDSSRVEYFITHPVSNVRNTAGVPSGEVHLVPTLQGWDINGKVTVDLRTLETGIGMRDRHVKSEEYLNVEAFPLAVFEFVAAETDSPAVEIETPSTVTDSPAAVMESPSVPRAAPGVETEAPAIAPEAGTSPVPSESSQADSQADVSRLPEEGAGAPHVTEPRPAEAVLTPRGEAPRLELESLPRSWRAHAVGELTLHGVTRPLDVPVELTREGERLRVHGTFSIFLADYEIRRPSKFMLAAGKHADIRVDLLWAP